MIQLFETTSIDSNCDIGPNDKPFLMPIAEGDHIFLRLQVPYYLVDFNGGGLPIGANIDLSIWNVAGDAQLCGYGKPSLGKYLYNFVNSGTKRIAEYRFMIPLRLPDDYITQSIPVAVGDNVLIIFNATTYNWIYGVDPLPYPFIDYKAGYICVRRLASLPILSYVNNSAVVPANVFVDDNVSCFTDTCFRVRIKVTFGGVDYSYFTKVFQMVNCDDETLYLKSAYGYGMTDCAGQYYVGANTSLGASELYLRVMSSTERVPSRLSKSVNAKCFLYRSELTKQVRMRSFPMPQWFADAVETLSLGKNFTVDGQPYQFDAESIFENSDLNGSVFQNINVLLSQCKCENVFVC